MVTHPVLPPRGHGLPEDLIENLPDVIDYTGEFGTEIVLYLPFLTWLSQEGHLRNRYVKIYRGMRSFYSHLECKGLIEKDETRVYVGKPHRRMLPVVNEETFDGKFNRHAMHVYPDLRSIFQKFNLHVKCLQQGKPLLIIHNKYNIEWNFRCPVNHITVETLREIVRINIPHFKIVYIRHGMRANKGGYSEDHNAIIASYEDQTLLA